MPSPSNTPRRPRLRRWWGWAAGGLALALAFGLYAEPGFVVMLADQVWACF